MAKPDNGRRKRAAPEGAEPLQPLTIKFPMGLFERMEAYKNEVKTEARRSGQQLPTWADIVIPALEDYLKKKGA